ncbi:hypothetical protein ONS96_010579 [Cadophora gregata f. sp. sojae]|nr:hypothetical protein ONS96_010579 [Cadophora gregata f. sp. sojae]
MVWFGCSATVTDETQEVILSTAGFRGLGDGPYQTAIVRTSINRPDVFINVQPIPKGKTAGYTQMYSMLHDAVNPVLGEITPERIPKTIFFVDGITKVREMMNAGHQYLLMKTKNSIQPPLAPDDELDELRDDDFQSLMDQVESAQAGGLPFVLPRRTPGTQVLAYQYTNKKSASGHRSSVFAVISMYTA